MELTQPGDMLTAFFSVVVGAFSLGQATPNMESILTALGAAAEVFETIDRVSVCVCVCVSVCVCVYVHSYMYTCNCVSIQW